VHDLEQAVDSATRIYVCVTCRRPEEPLEPRAARSGARLYAALAQSGLVAIPEARLTPVECLSVCKRPCTVSFAAPGKWTYVYGDFLPETSLEIVATALQLYRDAPDGVIPWKMRPEALKRGVVARIPPLPVERLFSGPQQ
jgi:predicted metal-binding protein